MCGLYFKKVVRKEFVTMRRGRDNVGLYVTIDGERIEEREKE